MIKLIFTLIFLVKINAFETSSNNDQLLGKYDLLCGAGNKSWFLCHGTPNQIGSCAFDNPVFPDNTYSFSSNGTFEFDHGTLTSDPECDDDNCCSDMINVEGKWEFTNSERGLRVVALTSKENPSLNKRFVLFNATIVQLDENVLKLSQLDSETGERYELEFHKK